MTLTFDSKADINIGLFAYVLDNSKQAHLWSNLKGGVIWTSVPAVSKIRRGKMESMRSQVLFRWKLKSNYLWIWKKQLISGILPLTVMSDQIKFYPFILSW